MLRGQASLQELIGRSFMTRKRPAPRRKKAEAAEAAASTGKDAASNLETTTADASHSAPLRPGEVLCPVCGLPSPEKAMNSHLGKSQQLLPHCLHFALSSHLAFCLCRQLSGTRDLAAQ